MCNIAAAYIKITANQVHEIKQIRLDLPGAPN